MAYVYVNNIIIFDAAFHFQLIHNFCAYISDILHTTHDQGWRALD